MKIKNIIFDVGNVFIMWDPYPLFLKFFKTKAEVDKFFKEINFWHYIAEMDKGFPIKNFVKEASLKYPRYKNEIRAYDENWLETIPAEISGTKTMAKKLQNQGYKTYILSNFEAEKYNISERIYNFTEGFDGGVVSAEVKERKPDRAIYEILLSKYNLKPEECVFLDDKPENIETAVSLGIKGIVFKSCRQAEEELKKLGVL